jgi:hypothetical protein
MSQRNARNSKGYRVQLYTYVSSSLYLKYSQLLYRSWMERCRANPVSVFLHCSVQMQCRLLVSIAYGCGTGAAEVLAIHFSYTGVWQVSHSAFLLGVILSVTSFDPIAKFCPMCYIWFSKSRKMMDCVTVKYCIRLVTNRPGVRKQRS